MAQHEIRHAGIVPLRAAQQLHAVVHGGAPAAGKMAGLRAVRLAVAHVVLARDEKTAGIEEGRKPGIARHILRDAVDDLHHTARLALRLPAIGVDHSGSVRRKFKFQHRKPPKSDLLDTSSCMIGAC